MARKKPTVYIDEALLRATKVWPQHVPASAAGAQVEHNLAAWVSKARCLGATWSQIGEALGMARQSAWERFSGEE